jgi:hypothetical protein
MPQRTTGPFRKLDAIAVLTGLLFPEALVGEDLLAARRGQRVVLGLGVLVAGGDPPVADSHGRDCIAKPPTM